MAIYSLRLTPIGKTTQKRPHTAAAHIRYIARSCALSHSMAERMPEKAGAAMRWLRREEDLDRKNARVADKLVIALPRELTVQQRITLVWEFAEHLTQGRASWYAAIHAKGKDRDNPHCHLLVRDRDVSTGQRVVMFSAGAKELKERAGKGQKLPTTLAQIRALWEEYANKALARAGRSERIDRRSLKEQGIGRSPQVHEGPNIRAMHGRGFRPQSQDRTVKARAIRRCGTPATRMVRYTDIDQGLTRVDYNAALRGQALRSDAGQRDVTGGLFADPAGWLRQHGRGRAEVTEHLLLLRSDSRDTLGAMADTQDDKLEGLRADFLVAKAELATELRGVFADGARAADSLVSMAEEFGPAFVLDALDRDPADVDERGDGEAAPLDKGKIERAILQLLDLQDDIDTATKSLEPLAGRSQQRLDIQGERFVIDAGAGVYYREDDPSERFPLEPAAREGLSLAQQLAREHGVELAKPRPEQDRDRSRER